MSQVGQFYFVLGIVGYSVLLIVAAAAAAKLVVLLSRD